MRSFVDAWEAVDIERLVALLAEDALMTMPPEQMRIAGAAAIGGFFATVPLDGRLDRIRLLPTRANGQPALAAYVQEADGAPSAPTGSWCSPIDGDRIAASPASPATRSCSRSSSSTRPT